MVILNYNNLGAISTEIKRIQNSKIHAFDINGKYIDLFLRVWTLINYFSKCSCFNSLLIIKRFTRFRCIVFINCRAKTIFAVPENRCCSSFI